MSWTTLLSQLESDLQAGNWRIQRYRIGTNEVQYTSLADFLKYVELVRANAFAEDSNKSTRVYAKNASEGIY